jgi:hypothetical protein
VETVGSMGTRSYCQFGDWEGLPNRARRLVTKVSLGYIVTVRKSRYHLSLTERRTPSLQLEGNPARILQQIETVMGPE